MNDDYLKKIGRLLDERIGASERKFEARLNDTEKGITTLIDSRLSKFDGRLSKFDSRLSKFDGRISKLRRDLEAKIDSSASQVMGDIGQFMETILAPMIDRKADRSQVDRIERKIDIFADKFNQHDVRLHRIELTPTVANELRARKS